LPVSLAIIFAAVARNYLRRNAVSASDAIGIYLAFPTRHPQPGTGVAEQREDGDDDPFKNLSISETASSKTGLPVNVIMLASTFRTLRDQQVWRGPML
jgi:hypothetical protein